MPLICSDGICVNWSLVQIVDNPKYISIKAFYDVDGGRARADAIRSTSLVDFIHLVLCATVRVIADLKIEVEQKRIPWQRHSRKIGSTHAKTQNRDD